MLLPDLFLLSPAQMRGLARFKRLMATKPPAPEDRRPLVSPDRDIVAAVAEELGTSSLYETLRRIRRAVLRPGDPNYRLADLTTSIEIAAAMDGIGLSLLDRWTYALCPVDMRDNGTERLLCWGVEHVAGSMVQPPSAGDLPAPERASQVSLEHAEKAAKRLVAWRWLAQRFPEAYADAEAAQAERRRLNAFIEETCSASRPSAAASRYAARRPGPGLRAPARQASAAKPPSSRPQTRRARQTGPARP